MGRSPRPHSNSRTAGTRGQDRGQRTGTRLSTGRIRIISLFYLYTPFGLVQKQPAALRCSSKLRRHGPIRTPSASCTIPYSVQEPWRWGGDGALHKPPVDRTPLDGVLSSDHMPIFPPHILYDRVQYYSEQCLRPGAACKEDRQHGLSAGAEPDYWSAGALGLP